MTPSTSSCKFEVGNHSLVLDRVVTGASDVTTMYNISEEYILSVIETVLQGESNIGYVHQYKQLKDEYGKIQFMLVGTWNMTRTILCKEPDGEIVYLTEIGDI